MTIRAQHIEKLPLFASEEALAAALMGAGNTARWRQIAPCLERRGFPTVNAEMGGRYVPAVKAFFDKEYGLSPVKPAAVQDGPERFGDGWKKSAQRRQG